MIKETLLNSFFNHFAETEESGYRIDKIRLSNKMLSELREDSKKIGDVFDETCKVMMVEIEIDEALVEIEIIKGKPIRRANDVISSYNNLAVLNNFIDDTSHLSKDNDTKLKKLYNREVEKSGFHLPIMEMKG